VAAALLLFVVMQSPAQQVPDKRTAQHVESSRLSIEDLTSQAGIIAVGKVSGVRSEWNEDRTRIRSIATINVGESLKGNPGSTLDITTPGGEVGTVGELYTHMASFKKDEDVVVFAQKDKQGHLRVLGGSQGKFSLVKDQSTGTVTVASGLTLESFKSRIARTLNTRGQK
jgi:hypothetical protein